MRTTTLRLHALLERALPGQGRLLTREGEDDRIDFAGGLYVSVARHAAAVSARLARRDAAGAHRQLARWLVTDEQILAEVVRAVGEHARQAAAACNP